MKSFIRHIIGSDEKVLLIARLHWICAAAGFAWMLGLIALGLGLDNLLWTYFGSSIPFSFQEILGIRIGARTPVMLILFGGCGVMIFTLYLIKYLVTEIALTNERVIYKTGMLFVDVEELDLVEIRAEHVDHGFLGRFLNYGRIELDSRFVGDIHFPAINKPYRLTKAMHAARAHISDPLAGADDPYYRHHK